MKKNDSIPLTITALTLEGRGVGHYGGMAVFAPATAAGDQIEALVLKVKPRYAYAKLREILVPSPERVPASCAVFPQCGGCVFRHIRYEAELELKAQAVRDAFTRIGKIDLELEPILGALSPERYRNKAQYPVAAGENGPVIGFYAPHSHRVVGLRDCRSNYDCRLQPLEFAGILAAIEQWISCYQISIYDENTHTGLLRHIYIRKAEAMDTIMVCLVVNGETLPQAQALVEALRTTEPKISGILLNVNRRDSNVILGDSCKTLWGEAYLEDRLCGLCFRISPLSFYQVNRPQAERLYEIAARYAALTGKETILDLYCGMGAVGLSMAKQAGRLFGVESVEAAVRDARENAALNGIANAEFLCADAAEGLESLRSRGIVPEVVLLDPPRKGCAAALLSTVAGMRPERIVYISCNPATLARDCALLQEQGYAVRAAAPVDLFPRTGHVECVALLTRR